MRTLSWAWANILFLHPLQTHSKAPLQETRDGELLGLDKRCFPPSVLPPVQVTSGDLKGPRACGAVTKCHCEKH